MGDRYSVSPVYRTLQQGHSYGIAIAIPTFPFVLISGVLYIVGYPLKFQLSTWITIGSSSRVFRRCPNWVTNSTNGPDFIRSDKHTNYLHYVRLLLTFPYLCRAAFQASNVLSSLPNFATARLPFLLFDVANLRTLFVLTNFFRTFFVFFSFFLI